MINPYIGISFDKKNLEFLKKLKILRFLKLQIKKLQNLSQKVRLLLDFPWKKMNLDLEH